MSHRRNLACAECRQAKAKCDRCDPGHRLNICSRCRNNNLSCNIDADYTRVSKKRQLEDLQDEVQKLRRVVQRDAEVDDPSRSDANSRGHLNIRPTFAPSAEDTSPINTTDVNPMVLNEPSIPELCQSMTLDENERTLEGVTLSQNEIEWLLTRFWSTFHPMLPFLDHKLSPSVCFKNSKLLFWTTICVSSNGFTKNTNLYNELIAPVKRLLWKIVGQVPHSISDMQGMLLLCIWPLPCATRWDDPTYILISAVRSSAIANGVHRPETAQEYRRAAQRPGAKEVLTMQRLWAACFIISDHITTGGGYPSNFSYDTSTQALKSPEGDSNLQQSLYITKLAGRAHRVLGSQSTAGERRNLIRFFDDELIVIQKRFESDISRINQTMLSYVQLQIQTYYLSGATPDTKIEDLLSAHNAAAALVDTIVTNSQTNGSVRTAPSFVAHALILAASVNLKVTKSAVSRYIDLDKAHQSGLQVVQLLRQSSLQTNDARARAARTIEQLWALSKGPNDNEGRYPRLTTSSRESASVVFDSIRTWQQQYGARTPGEDARPVPHAESTSTSVPANAQIPPGQFSTSEAPDPNSPAWRGEQSLHALPTPESAISVGWDEQTFSSLFPDSWTWMGTDLDLSFIEPCPLPPTTT